MLINSRDFQKLLQRKLTRKEFLQVVGLMILSVIGVSSVLSNVNKSLSNSSDKNLTDYGESSYGG